MNETVLLIYNAALLPVAFFSIVLFLLGIVSLAIRPPKERTHRSIGTPFVTVQVPSFNDPIAVRCVTRCLAFDYPKDRYEIQIVDDSTHEGTRSQLKALADAHENVTYVGRESRFGFKPGALQHALASARGEFIVVFDADWLPQKDFLNRVVEPFVDPEVAIVQTRQGFYNHDKNLVTRFAAYTLMVYHVIVMPIHNRVNSVFFCGTAGAIRRSALETVGGWNPHSVTEDAELTLRMLLAGYKTTYLPAVETQSEVPETIEAFCKQQARWSFGNTRVFLDNAGRIMFGRGLNPGQRVMITYTTLGNLIAPAVVLMTIAGMLGWFTGQVIGLFSVHDLIVFAERFGLTIGFVILGAITLARTRRLRELGGFIASAFTVGLAVAVTNSWAVISAFASTRGSWYCTPKKDNTRML